MKQNGYFLIKVRKTVNLYLWAETEEKLQECLKEGMQIVPYFKDGDKEYLEINGKLVRIA